MEAQISESYTTVWSHTFDNVTQSPNSDTRGVRYPRELRNAATAIYVIMIIGGASGNFITILALAKCTRLRNATTAFVINLAVADLIFCCFTLPLQAASFAAGYRIYGDGALCTLFAFATYSNVLVSLFTVTTITVNRYICIVHSMWYRRIYRRRYVAIMIAGLWLSAFFVLSLPLFQAWGKLGPNTRRMSCDIIEKDGKSPKTAVFIIILLCPTLTFIFCYSKIYLAVKRAFLTMHALDGSITPNTIRANNKTPCLSEVRPVVKKTRSWVYFKKLEEMTDTPQAKQRRADLQVLKVALVVFICYIICYFPVALLKILKSRKAGNTVYVLSHVMAFLANCINPLIYVALSDEYRKAYFNLFGCKDSESSVTSTEIYDSRVVWNVSAPNPEIT